MISSEKKPGSELSRLFDSSVEVQLAAGDYHLE